MKIKARRLMQVLIVALGCGVGAVQAQMEFLGRFCLEAVSGYNTPSESVHRYVELNVVQYDGNQWSMSGWVDALRGASDRFLVTGSARNQGGFLEVSLVGGGTRVDDPAFQVQVSLFSLSSFVGLYSDSEAADPYGADVWTLRQATCR